MSAHEFRNTVLHGFLSAIIVMSAACTNEESAERVEAPEQAANVRISFRVAVPDSTPAGSSIYIAGNLIPRATWLPDGLPLEPGDEPDRWTGEIELPRNDRLEYKVTRGTWPTVEKRTDGSEIANRVLQLTGDLVVDIMVESWADVWESEMTLESTITGNVRRHEKVASEFLDHDRDVLVYLPPGYEDETDRHYPVLYMHDAQNVFDAATSFTRIEWGADEHAEALIRSGQIEPLIIVAIANTDARVSEYTPTAAKGIGVGGRGSDYIRFIVRELQPFINTTYRTKTDASNTGICGSSLGGLISLYASFQYPDVFGKCAAVSPSLWWDDRALLEQIENSEPDWTRNLRLWIDLGTLESAPGEFGGELTDDVIRVASFLESTGRIRGRDLRAEIIEGGRHNEAAWAERFDDVLRFLFPADGADGSLNQ